MASDPTKAWHKVFTSGSKQMQDRLKAAHGHKPEFQNFLKGIGADSEQEGRSAAQAKKDVGEINKEKAKADRLKTIAAAAKKVIKPSSKRVRAMRDNADTWGGGLGGGLDRNRDIIGHIRSGGYIKAGRLGEETMSLKNQLVKEAILKHVEQIFEKDSHEYDYEGEMAKTQLRGMIMHAKKLHDMLDDDTNLPEWVQSKITLAADYMQTASDYIESQEDLDEEVEQTDEAIRITMGGVELPPKSKRKRAGGKPTKSDELRNAFATAAKEKRSMFGGGMAGMNSPLNFKPIKQITTASVGAKKTNEEVQQIDEKTHLEYTGKVNDNDYRLLVPHNKGLDSYSDEQLHRKLRRENPHLAHHEVTAIVNSYGDPDSHVDVEHKGKKYTHHVVNDQEPNYIREEVEQIDEKTHLEYTGKVNDNDYRLLVPHNKDLGDYSDEQLHRKLRRENPHLAHHEVTAIVNSSGEEDSHVDVEHKGKKYTHHVVNHQEPNYIREALDPVGHEDSDVNNDGKVNGTDKYLLKRRAIIARAIKAKMAKKLGK